MVGGRIDQSDDDHGTSCLYKAATFNQPIGTWDTSTAIDMNGMYCAAAAFNQPIGTWNPSAVTNMQPIGAWNASAVTIGT